MRLLFERVEDAEVSSAGRPDFYLYVWIQDLRHVAAFQAVLNEEYVADFHEPSRLEFTYCAGTPLKHSPPEPLAAGDREILLAQTRGMESPVFGRLVRTIESIIHGARLSSLDLTQGEHTRLKGLLLPAPGGAAHNGGAA